MKTEPKLTELEQEFKRVFDQVNPQIQEKMKAAAKLITEAVALSDLHGLPFKPKHMIMWCKPSYIPESFNKKFGSLSEDDEDEVFVQGLTNTWGGGYDGWQQSQVC